MIHVGNYLLETRSIAASLNVIEIKQMVDELVTLRSRKGRLWIVGLGGSAANASHAANDFRKLCGIDAQCPTDNVAEFSARANDDGLDNALYMQFSRPQDALLVLSVGGGNAAVSGAIVGAINDCRNIGMKILAIVGRDGGHAAKNGDCVIIVPTVNESRVTPHTEGWQSVILHCIVSHPKLQRNATKW